MENTKVNGPATGLSASLQTQPGHALPVKNSEAVQARFLRAFESPPEPLYAAFAGGVWQQPAITTPVVAPAQSPTHANGELAAMLERVCSAMYVGDKSVTTQRVVLALDHVLPGAAAEVVREGVHLTIRLHARTEHSYRLMSSQREALLRAVSAGDKQVDVLVVQNSIDRTLLGDDHG